jgi:hypothetical protein
MSKTKGPGQGHVRQAPLWPPVFCSRCRQIIGDDEALRINGRWEHALGDDGSQKCPRPGIDDYEEDSYDAQGEI